MSLVIPRLDPYNNGNLYAHIYSFLDKDTQRDFSQASKYCCVLFTQRYPMLLKIGRFIQDNYQIIGSCPRKLNLAHFFCASEYLLNLGEGPADATHALLTGILVNLLWNVHFPLHLLAEGGTKMLKHPTGTCGLVYIAPHILAKGKSWDFEPSENLVHRKYVEHVTILIEQTQCILRLFSDCDKTGIDEYCAYLAKTFGPKVSAKIWKGIASNFEPSTISSFASVKAFIRFLWQTDPVSHALVRLTFKYWLLFYLRECHKHPKLVDALRKEETLRDALFLSVAALMSGGSKTGKIFLSSQKRCDALNEDLKSRKNIRYLSLVPRTSRTVKDVFQSLAYRIFGKSIQPHASVGKSPLHTHPDRIEQLLCFNPKNLGELGKNHVGEWEIFTLVVISTELDKIDKMLDWIASYI